MVGIVLDRTLSIAVYRLFQESLTNIIRHADASTVQVDLKHEGGLFSMQIQDDGKGIDPGRAIKPKSFGLIGMQERVRELLLDLSMPGRGGMDTLRQLKSEYPQLPVLILSIYPEEQYAVRALKDGAAGYLTKESAPEELVEAIRKAARGRKYVSPTLAEMLADDLATDQEKLPHETLSDREYQVMLMLASGHTVSEIADQLSLSVKTISTNRARLLRKMGMKTNAEITYYAIRNGLVA
jgi:two-component system invasion response regulator UvrY